MSKKPTKPCEGDRNMPWPTTLSSTAGNSMYIIIKSLSLSVLFLSLFLGKNLQIFSRSDTDQHLVLLLGHRYGAFFSLICSTFNQTMKLCCPCASFSYMLGQEAEYMRATLTSKNQTPAGNVHTKKWGNLQLRAKQIKTGLIMNVLP